MTNYKKLKKRNLSFYQVYSEVIII